MGKKTKVVIDTNVIISAFGWHSTPKSILENVNKGTIINYTSIELLTELIKVVRYPKLRFPESLQVEIIETVFSISAVTTVAESIDIIKGDPADNRILECAISADVDYIISGDAHLLNLKIFRGIKIVSPSDFLHIMNSKK
jgi:putative PIN family toxin of toxin-antitoxin system